MRRLVTVMFLAVVLAIGAAAPVRSADDAGANRLLVEAVALVEQAEAAEAPGDRAGLYRRALGVLDAIVADHPSSDLAVKLATGQSIGALERAEVERQWRLSQAAECIELWDRLCLLDLANAWVRRIDAEYDPSWVLSMIATGRAAAREFTQALHAARSVSDLEMRAWTLGAVAWSMAEAGAGPQAEEVFVEAVGAARAVQNAYGRAWALGNVAGWQADASDISRARQTVREATDVARTLKDPWYLAMVLAPVAEAQIKIGDVVTGRRTLGNAMEFARRIDEPTYRVEAMASIAWVQGETGDLLGARETIEEALDYLNSISVRFDSLLVGWSRDGPFSEIAYAQANTGDLEDALQTAENINDPYWRALAFAQNAEAELKFGYIDGAKRSVERSFDVARHLANDTGIVQILAVLGSAIPAKQQNDFAK